MKKKAIKTITTLDEILDNKYGKTGTSEREKWEQEFKVFQLRVMNTDTRKKQI